MGAIAENFSMAQGGPASGETNRQHKLSSAFGRVASWSGGGCQQAPVRARCPGSHWTRTRQATTNYKLQLLTVSFAREAPKPIIPITEAVVRNSARGVRLRCPRHTAYHRYHRRAVDNLVVFLATGRYALTKNNFDPRQPAGL